MNFDKESISEKKKNADGGGGGEGGEVEKTLKPKQYVRLSREVNTKQQPSTQCKSCGTINITKYVNYF